MSTQKKAFLGQILKGEGFLPLIERIKTLSEKEYNDLVSINQDKPISELNQLVGFVPDFFYIKTDEGKNTTIIQDGVYDFLDWAFENGAHPNTPVKYGMSVFLKASQLKDSDLIKYFIDNIKDLDIQQKDGRGQDILMHSVLSNSEEVLQYILSTNEFDINKQYILLHNKTVLHAACGDGNETMINILLENGADLTIIDDYENEPISMIPTQLESPLSEEETTEEKVQKWEQLYENLAEKTKQALNSKKKNKIYKTSF